MNKIAVFPGSFSPFTLGHKAVVDSALLLFDKVIIAVGNNPEKNQYFSIEERLKWINDVYKNTPNGRKGCANKNRDSRPLGKHKMR